MADSQQTTAASSSNLSVQDAMRKSVVKKVKAQGSLTNFSQGDIAVFLSAMKDRVAAVLPNDLSADQVLQMAATMIQRNPQIAKCTPVSLLGAVMQASILGFSPVDSFGYCYFVPYGNSVQFQIGYKGYIDLARRSGEIKMIYAEVIREGDIYDIQLGLERKLEHKSFFDSSKPITHVYAVCHFKNGGYDFVVLSKGEVERLRMRSPMQNTSPSGAWKTDYDAMAKAKALKQLAKNLPLSLKSQAAIQSDGVVIHPDSFNEDGTFKIEDADYEIQEDEAGDNQPEPEEQTADPIKKAKPQTAAAAKDAGTIFPPQQS